VSATTKALGDTVTAPRPFVPCKDFELCQRESAGLAAKYGVRIVPPKEEPWGAKGARVIHVIDPTGILWHISQFHRQGPHPTATRPPSPAAGYALVEKDDRELPSPPRRSRGLEKVPA
jgi:hypothetical protein